MKLNIVFAAMVLAGLSVAPSAGAQQCLTRPATVGFLPKMDTDPYFHVARDGAMEAQKEVGGKVIQQGPSTATADAQIEFINSLVAQKIDVLAIAGTDANALAPALKRAAGQGVRVISYDSDVAKSARAVYVNQVKSDSLANQMLESMGAMIDYTGEFAILSSTPTATNQNAWVDLMKKRLATEAKFSKMKLVQVAYGEESEQVNQQQALALAEAFPNLKGIIVPAGIGLPAAARALEQSGGIKRIKLTGLAPASFMKKYIQSGAAQDIWWNVTDLGYLTYHVAQAVAQCKITGKAGETFTAGRLGKYTIGADGEVLLGEAKVVTPKNLEEFKF
jgi:rhamnose transport system substrate-binding protein